MHTERRVRLFRHGRNQVLRIPREFELEGDEAIIRIEGKRLIVEPVENTNRLIQMLKRMKSIDEELPRIEDPPFEDEEIF